MTKRCDKRSRGSLTDLDTGGEMWGGGDVEGGLGVMVNSFICPVQLIVFCFFNQRLVPLIMSFLIQEYEWLTSAKREI